MTQTVKASGGADLPIEALAKTFTYDGSGNVETISVEYQGTEYVQTFTYTGSSVTNISQWVPQA